MKYQKPRILVVNEQIVFNANAQYIVNITDQWCHGDACGGGGSIELPSGTGIYDDDCIEIGVDPTGKYQDLKCLETGDLLYHQVIVDFTYGGSSRCDIDQTPVIIHWTFTPSLPPVCTITAEINEEGRDACQQPCQ